MNPRDISCQQERTRPDWSLDAATRPAPLVYVVDDSSLMRKPITIALQRARFQVRCFADGITLLQAVHTPETLLPDLILLDIELPQMNGFQVTNALKHFPRIHHCPLVIISRHSGLLNHLRAHLPGARDWIDKPLLAAVRAALSSSASLVPPPSLQEART